MKGTLYIHAEVLSFAQNDKSTASICDSTVELLIVQMN